MPEEMKAGRELDTRLCELLEPEPLTLYKHWNCDNITSRKGFWTWYAWGALWCPIPVSADWAAMGKVIDELEKLGYGVNLYTPNSFTDEGLGPYTAHIAIVWHNPAPDCFDEPDCAYYRGNTLPHVLALAAAKALEEKREAV